LLCQLLEIQGTISKLIEGKLFFQDRHRYLSYKIHFDNEYSQLFLAGLGLQNMVQQTKVNSIDDRVNSNYYTRKIMPRREGKRLFGTEKYIYQQDGATCHTSKKSSGWCRRNLYNYVKKQDWPANSPDLNPLDYYFWSVVIKKMPKKRCETKEELIEAIEISMNKVSIQECEKAVNSFWTRCRTVDNAKGAY